MKFKELKFEKQKDGLINAMLGNMLFAFIEPWNYEEGSWLTIGFNSNDVDGCRFPHVRDAKIYIQERFEQWKKDITKNP